VLERCLSDHVNRMVKMKASLLAEHTVAIQPWECEPYFEMYYTISEEFLCELMQFFGLT